MPLSAWNRALTWLSHVRVDDPIDRRNAPAMQILFLFLGIVDPALWAFHIATAGMPRGGLLSLTTSLAVASTLLACVGMIRYGHFRAAIRLYLVAVLAGLWIEYLHAGFHAMSTQQIDPFMTLIVSGLVLGRGALWTIFVLLQMISIFGFAVDMYHAEQLDASLANLLSVVVSQLVAALVLDRTVNALRETLTESDQRGRALQHEMQARERTQLQLIHAQKLEATGRLASGIAHDFGNILHLISSYVSQRSRILDIARREEQEAAFERTLDGIESATDRGVAITRKLLDFARHDMSQARVFDATQAIASMQPMLRQLFPATVQLELPDAAIAYPVYFDRGEFELMIINIAANARDAMPKNGLFRIMLDADENYVCIRLSDTGHGITASIQQRIFEPFFSTKTDTGGTGLGLAIIRDMILAAGGDIEVDSTTGQGSTFFIRLPAMPADDISPAG